MIDFNRNEFYNNLASDHFFRLCHPHEIDKEYAKQDYAKGHLAFKKHSLLIDLGQIIF